MIDLKVKAACLDVIALEISYDTNSFTENTSFGHDFSIKGYESFAISTLWLGLLIDLVNVYDGICCFSIKLSSVMNLCISSSSF